jgi:phage terminase small subunit
MANRNAGANAQKSRAQHELAGTYRKDRHGDLKSPEAPTGTPNMPASLTETEQEAWVDLMVDLEAQGSVTKTDGKVAYQYVKLFCETEDVAQQRAEANAGLRVLEDNLSDVTPEDKVALFSQIVALHKTVSKCTDQLRQGRMAIRQYLVELGLTPASRGRIKMPAKEETKDEFTAFQMRRVQ